MNPLIDVPELSAALASGRPPVLFDVRYPPGSAGHDAYLHNHLPGAVFLDRDAVLAGPPGTTPGEHGGRHPLPDPDALQDALRAHGVDDDHPVVVYDEGSYPPGGSAARAWWILRWAGAADVRVLDGGYAAWVAAGHPVTSDVVEPPRGDVAVRPGSMPVLDADGAAARAATGALLDARAPARWRGDEEPLDPIAGRIPGARNLPIAAVASDDGRFLPPARIRALVGETDDPATYCGSGITAAHTLLALTTAGYAPALYVGSWSEWITDPDRPIERGEPT